MEHQADPLLGLLFPIGLILLIWLFARTKRAGAVPLGPTLVLKTFQIYDPVSNGKYIDITGRPAGIISWLLTAMGLETRTTFTLTTDRVIYRGASFRGEHYTVLPLPSIEGTSCGYTKPIGWVIAGILIIVFGLVIDIPEPQAETIVRIGAIALGVAFIVNYFLSKKMYLAVSSGQTSVAISFKKSVIENVSITLEKALEAIEVLNNKAVESQTKP